MTTPATAPDSRRQPWLTLAESGREAVAEGHSGGARRAALRTVPDTRQPAPTRLADNGCAVVSAADLVYVAGALADAAEYQECHLGQPLVAAAYRRIYRALGGQRPDTPRPGSATVATAGAVSGETVTGAAVEMASRADRARLLGWLWATCPDVVETGVAALREASVINADRARIRANRKATLRYRRRHRIRV